MNEFNALVLAGRRSEPDAFAEIRGGTHRALLDVIGIPMLVRVIRVMRASKPIGQIAVSIDDRAAFDSVPELRELSARGEIIYHSSLDSPSRSVRDALEKLPLGERVVVVTADHALLTPEMVDYFVEHAEQSDADVAVGTVTEAVVRASYPTTSRTYLRFRDGGYSGANLFAFRTEHAMRAVEFWGRAEEFRKHPWRLASVFGPKALLLFALRRLSFEAALERASQSIGCRIRAVPLPFAEAAIDVDHPSDLALATEALRARGERGA
jgi:GTP:adenosylcobinamide-phosphate guanylyltransferase